MSNETSGTQVSHAPVRPVRRAGRHLSRSTLQAGSVQSRIRKSRADRQCQDEWRLVRRGHLPQLLRPVSFSTICSCASRRWNERPCFRTRRTFASTA